MQKPCAVFEVFRRMRRHIAGFALGSAATVYSRLLLTAKNCKTQH